MRILNRLKILFRGVMIVSILSLLSACAQRSSNVPEIVTARLEELYGESFSTPMLGNRFDTGTITMYACPDADPGVMFTVTYDPRNDTMTEDYIRRRAAVSVSREITEKLRENGISGTPFTAFYKADFESAGNSLKNADLADILKKTGTEELYIHLAVNAADLPDEAAAQKLLSTLTGISTSYDGISLLVPMFCIPADRYDACSQALAERAEVNAFWFETYTDQKSLVIRISDGKAETAAAQILSAARGE